MLPQRILTALMGIPIGLAVIYLGGWYLAAVVTVIAVLGLWEFLRLAGESSWWVLFVGAANAIAITTADSRVPDVGGSLVSSVALPLGAALIVLGIAYSSKWLRGHSLLYCYAAFIAGLLYVPLLLSYLPLLRALEPARNVSDLPAGALWLFLVVGATWAMDIAAYAVGKVVGRHKLVPRISPGKTVEGAVGALLGAVAVSCPVGTWLGLGAPQAVLLGLLLGIGGQLGDLFESSLKRRAGVKDSGKLLPGHGGVLDRFDSLLFNAPIGYYFLRAVL